MRRLGCVAEFCSAHRRRENTQDDASVSVYSRNLAVAAHMKRKPSAAQKHFGSAIRGVHAACDIFAAVGANPVPIRQFPTKPVVSTHEVRICTGLLVWRLP